MTAEQRKIFSKQHEEDFALIEKLRGNQVRRDLTAGNKFEPTPKQTTALAEKIDELRARLMET